MAVATVFALLGIVGDIVPEGLKWSAVFAAFAVLLYRVALPARPGRSIESILGDREALPPGQFKAWLDSAEQLWIFAPSAVNLLTAEHCDIMRRTILSKAGGQVRIVVLDPRDLDTVALAKRQLDDSLSFPVQEFAASLSTVIVQLQTMAAWQSAGNFDYRLLDLNPGFSLIAINPHRLDGEILVEIHGFSNEAVGSRMHFTLSRQESGRWFEYWSSQFESIWHKASPIVGHSAP